MFITILFLLPVYVYVYVYVYVPLCRIERQPNEGGRTALFSQQEALIVDMVLQNNAIQLCEMQQRVIEDNVNFDGINSVSLSTVDRVLPCDLA